ncbi:cupin domain-containing protein [Aquiflexum sp.]|uniref:cupin domain-containing protein n=1 Tax=Aquiflexum sp. TaxID=1872584 RepID=UPI00359374D2
MNKKIELKATGETITFIKTSKDTNGEYVEVITTLPANGARPPLHRHVLQSELFEAVEGRLGLEYGENKIILEPGQSLTLPPNTLHTCYSVDGNEIKCRAVFTPALHIEYFLTEMFASSNRRNSIDPSPYDACFILRKMKGEYYLGDTSLFVQKSIFPLIAIFGKMFGLVKAKSKMA